MNITIGVIGLGYVGLPLAVAFSKHFKTIGYDISTARVNELKSGQDSTREVTSEELLLAKELQFSSDESCLDDVNFYIVTVPTPIDSHKQPDLTPLRSASELIGRHLSKEDIVVYESTVYPGATEEDCIPVVEAVSELKACRDFYYGYSPERINPGDKERKLADIKKIVSGCDNKTAKIINDVYSTIITAGTFLASSVKVAEAAKVIENTQRDTNIALVNELAQVFNVLDIDTQEVMDAAATKWNFMPFKPGLVGGHCISVDPYYLTHKAQTKGYIPDIISASRRINDGMGAYLAQQVVTCMVKNKARFDIARVLIAGVTFKENCPDIRNTKVVDVYHSLVDEFGLSVDVFDNNASAVEVENEYGLKLIDAPKQQQYDCVILAVPHDNFVEEGVEKLKSLLKPSGIFVDVKGAFPKLESDYRL